MRLRFRDASSGRTWKVVLGANQLFWKDFLSEIILVLENDFGVSISASDIVLSLNKKVGLPRFADFRVKAKRENKTNNARRFQFAQDPLLALDDDTPLRGVVCSGDLIWLLSPSTNTFNAKEEEQQTKEMDEVEDGMEVLPLAARSPPSPLQQQQQQQQEVLSDQQHQQTDPMELEEDGDATEQYYYPAAVGLRIPGHLLRVLCANPSLAATPPGIILLTAHAAMLETGFHIIIDNSHADNKINSTTPTSDYFISHQRGAVSHGIYKIQYTGGGGGGGGSAKSRQNDHHQCACTLTCSTMGQSVLLVASVVSSSSSSAAAAATTHHTRHLLVNCSEWIAPLQKEQHQHNTEEEHLQPHLTVTSGQRVILHHHLALDHTALRLLWNTLKDKLALPSVAAVCVAAGLPPPTTLLSLPTELKENVLKRLAALDLAALSATCSELRHAVSSDDLWRPLFLADFPSPPVDVLDAAPRKGYKWAYSHCYIERRRIQEEANRRRRHWRYSNIPGAPPFYPQPGPFGFPGIIGGNHDRLPFLGGTGGGGGGFGGLFRSGGGGGSINGSSARRQGGGYNWF